MQYDWILDVLNDLKAFAKTNGLSDLAEQLDDTSLVAAAEISRATGKAERDMGAHADTAGVFYRGTTASDNA
jgi:hypothetical protein